MKSNPKSQNIKYFRTGYKVSFKGTDNKRKQDLKNGKKRCSGLDCNVNQELATEYWMTRG